MANSYFKIVPVRALEQKEVYFHLYLQHEPNTTQVRITDPQKNNNFGVTDVNDWPLYDGLNGHSKVVARAQGMHLQCGMQSPRWITYFSLVFEDDRFKGSSLQVMGPVVENGEWSIVGGTGEFALAQGIIYKKSVEGRNDGMIEVDIHAFTAVPLHSGSSIWTLNKA